MGIMLVVSKLMNAFHVISNRIVTVLHTIYFKIEVTAVIMQSLCELLL